MSPNEEGIAIVGIACIFPGARNVDQYWDNICSGVSSIQDCPEGRWNPIYYSPASKEPNRFHCKRGGFVDEPIHFDSARYGIMPVAARAAEPDQLVVLELAEQALRDAGYGSGRELDRERCGVVLGRGGYSAAGQARLEQDVRGAEQLVAALGSLLPRLTQPELEKVRAEFRSKLAAADSEGVFGLVPNLAASRIAHQMDFRGPAFTLDAACASGLIALDHAARELRTGRADLMLSGAVHLCHTEMFWSVFQRLGALSRSQQIRPFDQRADGLLIGEGVAVLALRRERDALRDGNRIYAVVRGVGVASDGRSGNLMSPAVAGQSLAIERAWRESGLGVESIGLLEAHGTGMPLGDATELETVARFFGTRARTGAVIGSVKSMIGHAMTAAGSAGLIKTALAIYHGVLPPTLNCEQPREELAATAFMPCAQARSWPNGARVAGVNAFGFGGINAHAVLAASMPRVPANRSTRTPCAAPRVPMLFAADELSTLLANIDQKRAGDRGRFRLAIVDPSPERIAKARVIAARGQSLRSDRLGIFFSTDPLLLGSGKLAYVFPGLDHEPAGDVEDLERHFGLKRAARAEEGLVGAGLEVLHTGHVLARALAALGLSPALCAGHSLGEWNALSEVGLVDEPTRERLIGGFQISGLRDDLSSIAAWCDLSRAEDAIAELPDIAISHDNCPKQVIFCGAPASVAAASARLRQAKVLVRELPFASGVHTPFFAPQLAAFEAFARSVAFQRARVPVYSGVTCAPYPADAAAIRELAVRQLAERVHFRGLVERLYADGARVFVQLGSATIAGLVSDTLGDRPHAALHATSSSRSGLGQLLALCCALWTEGAELDWTRIVARPPVPSSRGVRLSFDVPLIRFDEPLQQAPELAAPPAAADEPAVAQAFSQALHDMRIAQAAVLSGWASHARPAAKIAAATSKVSRTQIEISLRQYPELIDHALYRQASSWGEIADLEPVMPMTGLIELMRRAASTVAPGLHAIAVEDVRALQLLKVARPVHASLRCTELDERHAGERRVRVDIENYASGTVVLASRYPEPPSDDTASLGDEAPAQLAAADIYKDRWLFHGPAYQGLANFEHTGSQGLRAQLQCSAAIGALLDAAAQVFGVWLMTRLDHDRVTLPARLGRVSFFGALPPAGTRVGCTARLQRLEAGSADGQLTLVANGRVVARVDGWQVKRFEADERLHALLTWPEKRTLSEVAGGRAIYEDRYRSAATHESLAYRYLRQSERDVLNGLPFAARRTWLSARIAAKDAVRAHLWRHGSGMIFPAEIVLKDHGGSLAVVEPAGCALQVSVTAEGDRTVAVVRA